MNRVANFTARCCVPLMLATAAAAQAQATLPADA
jgi:hypothetical protein